MKLSKTTRTILIVIGLALAGYLGWKWWTNRQALQGNPNAADGTGTNLNSTAPTLVGGSTGPQTSAPASLPINITLNETAAAPEKNDRSSEMQESNMVTPAAITRQQSAATSAGVISPDNQPEPVSETGE